MPEELLSIVIILLLFVFGSVLCMGNALNWFKKKELMKPIGFIIEGKGFI